VLRLSVTDRCNLRCLYCMPREGSARPMTCLPSLERLADAALFVLRHTGEHRIKLTGGEPTLRRDLPLLVRRLASNPLVEEVSMTTNAIRLRELANPLRDAGLKRLNISLDTLNPQRFHALTRGSLPEALDGIEAALASKLGPVKVNAVLPRSTWREDVPALLEYAASRDVEMRFIELMRTGSGAAWAKQEYIPAARIQEWLRKRADVILLEHRPGVTARRWKVNWRGRDITVGWITPQSHSFCDGCDRIRLDAHGQVRRCLMDDDVLPLLDLLASTNDAVVAAELGSYLSGKKPPVEMTTTSSMAAVGG
jgi:cyclic pyranopterin phosphate synthase